MVENETHNLDNTAIEQLSEYALAKRVGRSIAFFRKRAGYTQLELADKINYTDKAISKWERGDGIPDLNILIKLANVFGIRVVDILNSEKAEVLAGVETRAKKKPLTERWNVRVIVPIMSIMFVFTVATFLFGFSVILPTGVRIQHSWMFYIYAMPFAAVVAIIFSGLWGKHLIFRGFSLHRVFVIISISALLWTLSLAAHLSFDTEHPFIFYVIAAPIQAIIVLFYFVFGLGKALDV
ncbi:MAG: helix-turn-helix domain-containing protein [Firmicutes bacterium]|nr:helix-turn-helix domain-containing protein [Bacillota bacterium]